MAPRKENRTTSDNSTSVDNVAPAMNHARFDTFQGLASSWAQSELEQAGDFHSIESANSFAIADKPEAMHGSRLPNPRLSAFIWFGTTAFSHPNTETGPTPDKFECIGRRRSAWCTKAELSDRADSETPKEAPPCRVCITSGWMFTRGPSVFA